MTADPAPVHVGDHAAGVIGLAILRDAVAGDGVRVRARLADLRAVLERLGEPPFSLRRHLPAEDAARGYAAWADSYDDPGNMTIALDEANVVPMLAHLPVGHVLDAACGTGRHAAHLVERGHQVTGVDSSPEMLAKARGRVPGSFLAADLSHLPFPDGSFDAVVCALALAHERDIGMPVGELARVARPGARLLVSVPHPFVTGILGWRAQFTRADGSRAFIPEFAHLPSAYVKAFVQVGLEIRDCVEPRLDPLQATESSKVEWLTDAVQDALAGLPALLVWSLERT